MKLSKYIFDANNWKSTGIGALLLLGIVILLDSVLFSLVLALLKLALVLGALGLAARTAYLSWPMVKVWLEAQQKKES